MDDFSILDENNKEWEIKESEFVHKIDSVAQSVAEIKIEKDAMKLFSDLNIQAIRVQKGSTRRSDFEAIGVDFEVTAMHTYIPRTIRIDRVLRETTREFGKCHYMYMFLDSFQQPDIRILDTEACDNSASVLCIKQDISVYYHKIINKIDDKYEQKNNESQVIIFDFRGAHFDPVTLKKGISSILKSRGEDYPDLLGIVAAIPAKVNSDILDQPIYFFVDNPNSNRINEIRQKLLTITRVETSQWISPLAIIITTRSSAKFSIKSPCVNTPTVEEIHRMGLPVTAYTN